MIKDIKEILQELNLPEAGHYKNNFYIIPLQNSNDYAKYYTILNKTATNTEYPNFGVNTNNTTVKVTNYFEFKDLNIFLIADFENDDYFIKIGER